MRRSEDSSTHPVSDLASAEYRDPAFAAYARTYDALLDEYGVIGRPSFVDVPVRRDSPASVTSLRTFVLEHGTGTPVLFVHGTPATSAVWAPLLGAMPGIQAITVDRPGHGLSEGFDYTGLVDLRSHAVGFLESVLDALRLDRVVVAGSSMGGLWALWLALDRPRRVSAILQLGIPPGMCTDRLPFIFGLLSVPWTARLLRRLDPPSAAATRRLFTLMGDPSASLSDTFAEAFAGAQRLPTAMGGITHLIQQYVRFPGRLGRRIWLGADELTQVRQPTLMLAGDDDFLGGLDVARGVVAAMPDAELVDLGRGHLPWLQDPDGAAHAIGRFLRRIAGRQPDPTA